jgi:hypothetical protein
VDYAAGSFASGSDQATEARFPDPAHQAWAEAQKSMAAVLRSTTLDRVTAKAAAGPKPTVFGIDSLQSNAVRHRPASDALHAANQYFGRSPGWPYGLT